MLSRSKQPGVVLTARGNAGTDPAWKGESTESRGQRMENTSSGKGKAHRETGEHIFLVLIRRVGKGQNKSKESGGSTPNCPLLTWKYELS